MDGEQKFWLSIVGLMCGTICCLIVSIAFYFAFTNARAFEHGYSQQTLPGVNGEKWVKTHIIFSNETINPVPVIKLETTKIDE